MASLKYWLWLTEREGLGNQVRLSLLQRFGSPESIYFADEGEYLLAGLNRRQAAALADKALSGADRILGRCEELGLRILTMQDAEYPVRLKNIFDPPCLLYYKGKLPLFDEEAAVAVVGTRTATPYGLQSARELGYGLAKGGALVVSGLARGCDSEAIQGALRAGGVTVGVLGGGIDVIYPPENERLYADVAASGVLISEYPPGTETLPGHFPARNRVMSGLTVASLVIEAPARSGALITAALALDQGRDVYAVPGPISSMQSVGCNRLIRDGAGLVAEADDLLRDYTHLFPGKLRASQAPVPVQLHQETEKPAPAVPAKPVLSLSRNGFSLTDDQLAILRTLEGESVQVDDLIDLTQIPARRMLSALTVLELENLVTQESGKRFSLAVTLTE